MTTPGAGLGTLPPPRVDQLRQPASSALQAGSPQTIRARFVIVSGTGGGVFVYSTPGPGNPPLYSVSNATTDPYNNTIFPGIWAGQAGGVQAGFQVNGVAGQAVFKIPGTFAAPAAIGAVGAGGVSTLEMSGAVDPSPINDSAILSMYDNNAGGGTAKWQLGYFDNTRVFHAQCQGTYAGTAIGTVQFMAAADPSTGTSLSNVAQSETWHNVTVDAGWGSLGEPAQYRLLPGGNVQLRGDISHAGTTVQTDINSGNPLPSAYWPAATRYYRPPQAADGAGAIQVSSAGVITMRASGFTATQAILDGIYSL